MIHVQPPPGSANSVEAFGTSIFMGLIYDLVTKKWYIVIHNPTLCVSSGDCILIVCATVGL